MAKKPLVFFYKKNTAAPKKAVVMSVACEELRGLREIRLDELQMIFCLATLRNTHDAKKGVKVSERNHHARIGVP